jgi:hypothetical protein
MFPTWFKKIQVTFSGELPTNENDRQRILVVPYSMFEKALEVMFHQYGVSERKKTLDELLEWNQLWGDLHPEPFNWYGAVKALKVAEDHRKPFNVLTQSDKEHKL